MYEFHGWATIRETTEEGDDDKLLQIVHKIQSHITELNWNSGVLDLRAVNGEFQVWTAGYRNHKPEGSHNPVEIFKYISEIAPGSYGILYVRDASDLTGLENEFRVHVMARGRLAEHKDLFLSPFIPTVEDRSDD